ncbi:uncharacterized protein B0T23DRAFT_369414 [Neurospora hispaniola]|uniref:Uncharacterized protein n=1 Tax=Neurospora hispaniola TaxID=588809 RepID=A0AAJ0IF18_9PEZI|nr:hypothetical protein B0T23DRAFT_369414 [Neurospora hispaniola]
MRRRNDNDKDTEERARTEFVSCSLWPLCLALMMSSSFSSILHNIFFTYSSLGFCTIFFLVGTVSLAASHCLMDPGKVLERRYPISGMAQKKSFKHDMIDSTFRDSCSLLVDQDLHYFWFVKEKWWWW